MAHKRFQSKFRIFLVSSISVLFFFIILVTCYFTLVRPRSSKNETKNDSILGGNRPSGRRPWEHSQEMVSRGKEVFTMYCVSCHGKGGRGDGPGGAGIVPPPRDLVAARWRKGGSSKELFVTISEGIDGTSMGSYRHLDKLDRWALVQFVRSIAEINSVDSLSDLEDFVTKAL
ncbi:MAG: cytochrome c [Bdellovibrionales bacterium]|nr:cytochrome c [Bdellovibrionales bacterium]